MQGDISLRSRQRALVGTADAENLARRALTWGLKVLILISYSDKDANHSAHH